MSDVMIEATGLGKSYGSFVALKNASFELRRGEILGLLGPNGAGKSTTMKILTCFIAPSTGTAKVNGCDIWEDPIGARAAIGYLPESTPLYQEMLVKEYLDWVAAMRGLKGDKAEKRILEVVEEVSLEPKIASTIKELSKGYKQRVGLAQALIHEPPILILDEPLSGLDPNQAAEIRELIKSIGEERTVVLSTHNLDEVQKTCQRVLIIHNGRIVADDTPQQLIESTGGPRYRVTFLEGQRLSSGGFRDSKGPIDARAAFKDLAGVDSIRELSKKDGEVKVEISASKEGDLRPDIFRAAVEAGMVVVGFETKTQNLDQVFRDLTTADAEPENERRRPRKRAPEKAAAKAEEE